MPELTAQLHAVYGLPSFFNVPVNDNTLHKKRLEFMKSKQLCSSRFWGVSAANERNPRR